MSNEAVESTPSTPTSEISTTPVGFEMSLPDEISTTTSGLRMRGGGVRMRGAGVRMRSRAYMYPGGRKPIGFCVSWDPVDKEDMLGDPCSKTRTCSITRTNVVTTCENKYTISKEDGCYEEPMQLQEPRLNKSKHSCTRSQDCTNCSQAHKSSQDEDFA
ncbi:hypothetical protein Tco_0617524 [Tanacetum coccineum]